MLQKILNLVSKELDRKETDSEEFKSQSEKCHMLFEELSSSLNEEQKKKLLKLDSAYFACAGQWREDGYDEGLEIGFKLGVQTILDSLRS